MIFLDYSVKQMKNEECINKSARAERAGWFFHSVFFVLSVFLLSGCVMQVGKPSAEYQEKATYLYHFGQFVEWPSSAFPNPKAPVVIGILGGNPFGDDLKKIVKGGNINGHSVMVRRMTPFSDLKQCQILFVNHSVKSRLPLIFDTLSNAPVLTVGETDGFLKSGGMINFVTENGKVRFDIASATAQKVGLKMSSQLLMMASHRTNPAALKPAEVRAH